MAAKLQEKRIQIFNVKQQQKKIRNEWLISKIYCNFYLSIFTLNFFFTNTYENEDKFFEEREDKT